MQKNKYQLVLASQSPRRKELLSWLNIPFKIQPSLLEECTQKTLPQEVVRDLANLKGRDIFKQEMAAGRDNSFIISSDTIVCLNEKIFGKPKTKEDARFILSQLSGKTHSVLTAVSFFFNDFESKKEVAHCFVKESKVTFDTIDDDVMNIYLDSGESMDKAGAYGIQKMSLTFVSHLDGSYSNVVGFPLSDVISELKSFFALEGDVTGKWREMFLDESNS